MATLTNTQLDAMRQLYRQSLGSPRFTKPQLNAVFQAVEDAAIANQSAFTTAINNAQAGTTAAEKKAMFAVWCNIKYLADK